MATRTYSQTSRDRLAFNGLIVIPVLATLALIRYFQTWSPPKLDDGSGRPL